MGIDSDDIVSLPSPPPPRPAARREAIDAALRRFDGIEEVSAQPRPRSQRWWTTTHRRPAGAFATVALIALVSIPVIQIALREGPPSEILETGEPAAAPPVQDIADPARGAPETPQSRADEAPAAVEAPTPPPAGAPSTEVEEKSSFISFGESRKVAADAAPAEAAAPAPLVAPAPPPPPPPPPPPEPERMAEETSDQSIVVTGTQVRRPNLESPTPVTVIGAQDAFLSRLQAGLRANDRRAILGLVALPLRVNFSEGTRTYRSRQEIERDFDRIFTPEVRWAVVAMRPDTLTSRDGGRLKGNDRLWFGCGRPSCAPNDRIRIREVNPER
ncbi:MAG TPA: hypothetical protein VEB39_08090 [Sphingomicrobium sp.]|nr:hypothetical protein [Sphingomicrobium sp.]